MNKKWEVLNIGGQGVDTYHPSWTEYQLENFKKIGNYHVQNGQFSDTLAGLLTDGWEIIGNIRTEGNSHFATLKREVE